ncbi:MAG: recombinase family protein [Actinobacteria bacterium]|nr:recombinase family protein [Actinomycetota bacterium]
MKRVAGYVRVSSVGGREGDSFQAPPAQEDAIRAHCRARRLEVVDVVHELDASGGTMARPKLQALISEIEAGKLNGIVVARLDRFARTLVGGIQTLEQIHVAGGFVQTVEGSIDTSASSGAMAEMQLNILLTFAQWERATRAEGFASAKQRAVARGVHISGTVPVGYLRPARGARLEFDSEKASSVRDAFELRATGAPYGEVARLLDRTLPGGPSGKGVWNRNTVSRLLANPVYVGEARQGEYRQPGAHLPVVSQEVFDTVQALARRVEDPTTRSDARSLLAGIARCGSCGYALDRNRVNGHYFAYRCRGRSAASDCEAPASAMADKLDLVVEEAVLAHLAGRQVEQVASADDIAELHGRLTAVRAKRANFENPDYVAVLGVDAAIRALRVVDEEILEVEQELAERVVSHGVPPISVQPVGDIWPTLTTAERREVIGSMVEAVTVSRAPHGISLAERTSVFWKGEDVPVARPSRGRRKRPEVEARMTAA